MPGTQPQIEDVAAASLGIIRQCQREGPYFFGGWSAFGVVAYEIAQQLLSRGCEVSLLALFDTRNPALSKQTLNQKWRDAHRQKFLPCIRLRRSLHLSLSLLIFPEGERRPTGQMGAFQSGVGLLAMRLAVPVLPIYLENVDRVLPAKRIMPRHARTRIAFGRALYPDGQDPRALTHELEQAIRNLGEEQHGTKG